MSPQAVDNYPAESILSDVIPERDEVPATPQVAELGDASKVTSLGENST